MMVAGSPFRYTDIPLFIFVFFVVVIAWQIYTVLLNCFVNKYY